MDRISGVLKRIEKQIRPFTVPSVTEVSFKNDPYLVLISCILSLRTQDKTTTEASRRLFQVANTPQKLIKLSVARIRKLIYPVGFYRRKAKVIVEISKKIVYHYDGKVPQSLDELLAFKGVGRKTANLVLGLGFHIPAICVDTHVHRIPNRLGWVRTKSPEETEYGLMKLLPKKYWISVNTILVAFGQQICLSVAPFCSRCFVRVSCLQRGVEKSR